jgi:ubiquinone/menaquinone biosynthesis C-methylase UbiE
MLTPEHFSEWNEEMVHRYDPEVFHHHPRGVVRWVENKRVNGVIRSLDAQASHKVLDVGCGAGNILAKVTGAERRGVDISDFMVKRAVERLGNQFQITKADAEQLPFPDASFDRVIAASLFSHVLHPEQVIAELKRVTMPGGRIVISISDEDQIEKGIRWTKSLGLHGMFFGKSQVYSTEYHLHHFSLKRVRELAGANLKEISVKRVPFIFPVHAIVVYQR